MSDYLRQVRRVLGEMRARANTERGYEINEIDEIRTAVTIGKPISVAQRSAAEEQAWWAQVAKERGMTLEQLDGDPPEAPPAPEDGPSAAYWGWAPLAAALG